MKLSDFKVGDKVRPNDAGWEWVLKWSRDAKRESGVIGTVTRIGNMYAFAEMPFTSEGDSEWPFAPCELELVKEGDDGRN